VDLTSGQGCITFMDAYLGFHRIPIYEEQD